MILIRLCLVSVFIVSYHGSNAQFENTIKFAKSTYYTLYAPILGGLSINPECTLQSTVYHDGLMGNKGWALKSKYLQCS